MRMMPEGPFPVLATHPFPLLFVTVSGSHLYGFPSSDSDIDLRGVHVLPPAMLLGLREPANGEWTVERVGEGPNPEEIVTHDVVKFARLLVRNNGYVLEQLFSPLVVQTSPEHEALKAIGERCITRGHPKHYLGFSESEWSQFHRRPEKTVKRLLYVFRVIMTGIYLQETGEVEANIHVLNERYRLPYVPELIALKLAGAEKDELPAGHGPEYYRREYERLVGVLQDAARASHLPEAPDDSVYRELDEFIVRIREGPAT